MIFTLFAISRSSARHLQEVGFLIALIGGVSLVVAGILGILEFSRGAERSFVAIAGVLLAVGMALAISGVHGGL